MKTNPWLKIGIVTSIALITGLFSTQAQRRGGMEANVTTGNPPGVVKKVDPEYPIAIYTHGAQGKGVFRLTINAKTGEVDQVKIVSRTPYQDLDKLAVKALLQWRFKPGTASPVDVPVEFYVHGGNRSLH
jgi:TonB family protein